MIIRVLDTPYIRNQYEVVVVHMHGDADNYTTDTTYFDLAGKLVGHYDKEEYPVTLKKYVKFIQDCMKEYPHGMGGNDTYGHVSQYELFAEEFIHRDNDCCDGDASPESIVVYFYDNQGIKRPCEILED